MTELEQNSLAECTKLKLEEQNKFEKVWAKMCLKLFIFSAGIFRLIMESNVFVERTLLESENAFGKQ